MIRTDGPVRPHCRPVRGQTFYQLSTRLASPGVTWHHRKWLHHAGELPCFGSAVLWSRWLRVRVRRSPLAVAPPPTLTPGPVAQRTERQPSKLRAEVRLLPGPLAPEVRPASRAMTTSRASALHRPQWAAPAMSVAAADFPGRVWTFSAACRSRAVALSRQVAAWGVAGRGRADSSRDRRRQAGPRDSAGRADVHCSHTSADARTTGRARRGRRSQDRWRSLGQRARSRRRRAVTEPDAELVYYDGDGPQRFDVLPISVPTDGGVAAVGVDQPPLPRETCTSPVPGLAEREWVGRELHLGEAIVGSARSEAAA